MTGQTAQGSHGVCAHLPTQSTPARNWGFDVTPARLITQLICERGICACQRGQAILSLFPGATLNVTHPLMTAISSTPATRRDGRVPPSAALDALNRSPYGNCSIWA
jgi:hypothetical protein